MKIFLPYFIFILIWIMLYLLGFSLYGLFNEILSESSTCLGNFIIILFIMGLMSCVSLGIIHLVKLWRQFR
jgi:hypothetical protein